MYCKTKTEVPRILDHIYYISRYESCIEVKKKRLLLLRVLEEKSLYRYRRKKIKTRYQYIRISD